jgi:hypothetical protein
MRTGFLEGCKEAGIQYGREGNLVRFAHPPEAENNGILELWNDGFKKTKLKAQIIALLILF